MQSFYSTLDVNSTSRVHLILIDQGYKHLVVIPNTETFSAAADWCVTNLSENSYSWFGMKFYFKQDKDAALFILKFL